MLFDDFRKDHRPESGLSMACPGGSGAEAFHRPECVSGFEPSGSGSTTLKWGSDGELNPMDLHKVLARLCLHDPQICEQLIDGLETGRS